MSGGMIFPDAFGLVKSGTTSGVSASPGNWLHDLQVQIGVVFTLHNQMLCSDMTLGLVSSCNFHLGKLSWALCQIYFLSKHTESYIFRIVVYVHILARNISTCSISIESNYYILCTCTYMIWLILLEVYTNEIWNTIKSFNPWIHFWIIRNAKCEWRLGSWNWPRGNGWGVNQLKMWLLGFM